MFQTICKALYAYETSNPEELAFQEDDTLYIIDATSDPQWWLATIKTKHGEPAPSTPPQGLIPSNYVQEVYAS